MPIPMVVVSMIKRKPRRTVGSTRKTGPSGTDASHAAARGGKNLEWLYGLHTALAATTNPLRRCQRLVATQATVDRLKAASAASGVQRPAVETLERFDLEALLPDQAVHQGVAVLAEPLPDVTLPALLERFDDGRAIRLIVLDQVTDPRNVGAILRSAAAFGADAVVVQDRHAPEVSGALAKAASGAIEQVPMVRVVNLARALATMQEAGLWCIGLDPEAETAIAGIGTTERIALVVGAEGAGLRRLVRETCDQLARIPISAQVESLNVATATAIALYELARADQGATIKHG